jgi:putative copper export protein
MDDTIRFLHLLAAAVWIGGMITVGALVPAMRRAGATQEVVRATARRFGVVAWAALGLAIATGIAQLFTLSIPTRGNAALAIKLVLVALAAFVAWLHQMLSRDASPALRAALQGVLLVLGLGILAAAIALHGGLDAH